MNSYRWGILICLLTGLLLLVQLGPAGAQGASMPLRAAWYISDKPDSYNSLNLPTELRTLHQRLCPTHLLLRIDLSQTRPTSDEPRIDPVRTMSDAALRRAIKEAHSLGLKVVLLPALFVDDGTWSGMIAPANISRWFSRYREIISHYARLAQETGVDILLIGAELTTLQNQTAEWERIIREVRAAFKGRLSYSANWWFDRAGFQNVLNMRQWALLDFIGITAYFELTNKKDPTVAEMRAAWQRDRHGQNVLNDLDTLRQRYNKPIVFWEFGYQSRDGTNIFPWDYTQTTPADEQEQADAYQAFFEVFSGRRSFSGYGLFAHQVGLPRNPVGYDVLGKRAERVIAQANCGR